MRIWHISDTHQCHDQLLIPDNIDTVICSGDCSNHRDVIRNIGEVTKFIEWYKDLPIKNKIYVAGNHDMSVERRVIRKHNFEDNDIIYLEHDYTVLDGIKIYGSPITPSFGSWAFMMSRQKIYRAWDNIPDDTDILVTHGPPKNILDGTINIDNQRSVAGCSNLFKRINKLNVKLHLFGHIHNHKDICNAGVKKVSGLDTIFSNGSVVTDGRMDIVSGHGNIFEYKNNKVIIK